MSAGYCSVSGIELGNQWTTADVSDTGPLVTVTCDNKKIELSQLPVMTITVVKGSNM